MLSPRWLKVLRDLGGNKTRTALVVLSIAIGVFAIGMIGGTNVVLSNDMTNAFMSIDPSSATLYSDPFDDELVASVRGMKDVAWAEGRRVLTLKMRGLNGQKQNLTLTAVPDYADIRINKIFPQSGAYPPGEHELVLERASLAYYGLKVGDSVTIELSDTKTRVLKLVGTVHDINTAPPIFVGGGYGYIAMSTLEWLGAPQNMNQLEVLVADNRMDKNHNIQVADEVRDRVEKNGHTVYYTYVGNPGKHPVDSTMQAIVYLLGALGLVSLLLSGFLVVNTISALLTQQTRQIGVMKAIGARGGQITGMYLSTVFAFGILALCVGVPLGALGAYAMGGFLANLVNFDPQSLAPTPHVLALEIAVGLGVPLLAALYPVISGVRVTAREAMSTFGSSKAGFGAGRIDHLLEHVRGVSRPILLSLRNTFRRKGRLVLTLSTLTLGGATFIAVFSVRDSTVVTLDQALQYFQYDLQVNFRKEYRTDYLLTQTLQVPGVAKAESIGGATAHRKLEDGKEGNGISILALRADTEMIKPILLEGRWLLPEDDNAVVLNTGVTQNDKGVKVGDRITLKIGERETQWTVVGLARSVMTGPVAYVNKPYYEKIMRNTGRTTTIWVVGAQHDAAFRERLTNDLKAVYKEAGINVGGTSSIADQRVMIQSQFDMLVVFLLIMAVLMAVVGGLGLMGTMSLNVLERTREIGVMRAIGASDGAVRQVFIVEGVLIGILSWLVGAVLAIPISSLLSYTVGESFINAPLTYAYSFVGLGLWLAVVLTLSILASILPARNASRVSIREVLAYE